MTTPEYFLITKDELNWIKNNCAHPETISCDGCEFACDDEKSCPCSWIGANALEEEILTRPFNSSTERDRVLDFFLKRARDQSNTETKSSFRVYVMIKEWVEEFRNIKEG